MPPKKKKLTKKEKARLEAERTELLRIEMERERQRQRAEEQRRREIDRQLALKRQQEEVRQNKIRREQLKLSMSFFDDIRATIDAIRLKEEQQREWEKFMRCNGLPNAGCPSDLRKYMHQWRTDTEQRQRGSRNWLLQADERSVLTHDRNVADRTRVTLKLQQGDLGDLYAERAKEVLGILSELEQVLALDRKIPPRTIADLNRLKCEIRVLLKEHLDEFNLEIMSYIERDMEMDRPGVWKHSYTSDIFKNQLWAFAKDEQINRNPKVKQNQHNEIVFPLFELQLLLPPSVELHNSTFRGLWLSYDHFSDFCSSFTLKRPRPQHTSILHQTKFEWRKRKKILENILEDCSKPTPLQSHDKEESESFQFPAERSYDIEKLYADYEDELNRVRRSAIGPEAYNLLDTDVNLRKYRIMGGIYCVDYLETPQQDKRINSRSFIRTLKPPDCLNHKKYYQSYKPPPPALPGVRRLPEEIEAEIRMMEAALDKLALVTVQLPTSVIWFEPPIACRWETQLESRESELTEGIKPSSVQNNNSHLRDDSTTDGTITPSPTPPPLTARSLSSPNTTSMKSSPRFIANRRKRSSQKSTAGSSTAAPRPVRELNDFDLFNIPRCIDITGLMKDFVVPRLPDGFCMRMNAKGSNATPKGRMNKSKEKKKLAVLFVARHSNVNMSRESNDVKTMPSVEENLCFRQERITEKNFENYEPAELFTSKNIRKDLKFREESREINSPKDRTYDGSKTEEEVKKNEEKLVLIKESQEKLAESTKTSVTSKKDGIERYMFSELLKDLERLSALKTEPLLQEEVLQKISESLSSSCSNSAAAEQDLENPTAGGNREEAVAYSCFRSFKRIGEEQKASVEQVEELQMAVETSSSSECDEEECEECEWIRNVTEGCNKGRCEAAAADVGGIHGILYSQNENGTDDNVNEKSTGKWSVRDVHDIKFNEDKFSIQFRTGRLGCFGFALNRYSNMPYQTWEIKPDLKSSGNILLSFTASIISLDMTISSAGFCVNSFQGGSTEAINNCIGRTLSSLAELKSILIASAVDIFPDDDAFCYTEGSCEKNFVMEMHLYASMSSLGLSHNFSWSRWNLLAGSRNAILLIRELVEGKKVPNYSTLLVTPLRTTIIECCEVSASFNAIDIAGMEFHADLHQLAQARALPRSLEKQRTMDPVLRDNVAQILKAIRPISFC